MNILTRNTPRQYLRNGKLNLSNTTVSSISSYGGGGMLSGNYLPATLNEDGSYTVDLSKVLFNGNIIASGDVVAYGSTEGSGGSTVVGNVTIYDGLDSESIEMALSANQGRVLYGYIGNTEEVLDQIIGTGQIDDSGNSGDTGGNVDLSNYYTKSEVYNKSEIDTKVSDLQSDIDNMATGGTVDLSGYYTKTEVDTKLKNYVSGSALNKTLNEYDNWIGEIETNVGNINNNVTTLQGYFTLSDGTLQTSYNIKALGEVTALSDRRVKDNIQPLTNRGELKPVTFIKDGKQQIGFIAQDVQELYPELVTDGEYLSLNYQQLTAVLAAQINELKKEIEQLKNEYIR